MRIQLSKLAIAIVLLACMTIDFSLQNWLKKERVIEDDIHSYYAYLPALFIYHDIKLSETHPDGETYYLCWTVPTKDDKRVIRMTMGLSILYAPFFFLAQGYTYISLYPENGFSPPYKFFLLISTLFYLFVGLRYLKKILIHYQFSDTIIGTTILLLGLGTNLLAYSSQSAPMSHAYSFCLFAIFIYYTIKWYDSQTIKNTIIVGLLIGLISLIRPSNIVLFLFFAFYGLQNLTDIKERFLFFIKSSLKLSLIPVLIFVVWIPQFIYWKIVTGHYLCYSYGDEGAFFFLHPKIIDGLFSFRKGWLLYTPMMGFALIGIFLFKNHLKKIKLPLILFFVINIYVVFSWWCWWYGGTYGQRSLVESYALLAIPFASFINYVSEKKWYYNLLFYSVALFFIWLNIFQTYQFEYHSLHYEGMSKELYFKQFGKMYKVIDYEKYIDWPNYENAKKGIDNEFHTLENINSDKNEKIVRLRAANDKYVCSDGSQNNIVIANRDVASEWETFKLVLLKNNKYAIRDYANHYFSTELGQKNIITSTRIKNSDWETFTLTDLGNSFFAFKAVNGKYIGLDNKSLNLTANSSSIGKNEKFYLLTK